MSKYSFEFSVSVRNQDKNEQMYSGSNVWEHLSYEQVVMLEEAAKELLDKTLSWGKAAIEAKKQQANV